MKARQLVGYLPKNWTGDADQDLSSLVSAFANILRRLDDVDRLAGMTWEEPGDIGLTTPDSGKFTTLQATTSLGYTTGGGGTVTQATNKGTAVTLNAPSGKITMNNANLGAGATVFFTLNNTSLVATDGLIVNICGGSAAFGNYQVWAETGFAGQGVICVKNNTAGALAEALLLRFAVIKAVDA